MAYKSKGGCTPITAKIKRTTKGGITQPLLNVGAPVKMRGSTSTKQTKSHPSAENALGIGTKFENKTGFAGDAPYTVSGGKGTIHGPKSSYNRAYEKRDKKVYGEMSKAEYIKEAKKQTKSFESTGKFDVPKAKKRKKVEAVSTIKSTGIEPLTKEIKIEAKLDAATIKPKAKVAPKTKTEVRKTAKVNKKLSQAAEARAAGNEKKALRKEKAAQRKTARLAKKKK